MRLAASFPHLLLTTFLSVAMTLASPFEDSPAEAQQNSASMVDVWFGTSTPRNGLSKGIYHGRFDPQTGQLKGISLAAELSSPGFLAKHPSGKMLYAVGSENGTASVVAYRIEGAKLTKDSSVPIGDGGSAHVAVSRDGKVVLTAQYGAGSTACFQLDENGSLLQRSDLQKQGPGSGVVGRRQDSSHAHWCGTSPDNRFVFVPDLGMDKVVIYRLESDNGKLTPHGFGNCPAGGGPRHMKFSPDGNKIYVLNELALSITTFDYDARAGTMTPIQTVQTLDDETKAGEVFNSASEIRVHPSGNYVYSANRGNDSISVFRVSKDTGKLTRIQVQALHGAWPRNFNLDPSGHWLLAAGKKTNSVTIFQINPDTGMLQYTGNPVFVPQSICVLF